MSNADPKLAMWQKHSDEVTKYIYYITAIDAACIALLTERTKDLSFKEISCVAIIPAIISFVSFATSFVLGLMRLHNNSKWLEQNYLKIVFMEGIDKGSVDDSRENIDLFVKNMKDDMEKCSRNSGKLYLWQLRTLAIGALFFVVWHVSTMLVGTRPLDAPVCPDSCVHQSQKSPLRSPPIP